MLEESKIKTFNIAIIYHNGDVDGWSSGALAKQVFDKLNQYVVSNVEINFAYDLIGYNYGTNPFKDNFLNPEIKKYDYYQFIDCTPPIDWYSVVKQYNLSIDIFDHHKNAYYQLTDVWRNYWHETKNWYLYDSNYSGAKIYLESIQNVNDWINPLFTMLLKPEVPHNELNLTTWIHPDMWDNNLLKEIIPSDLDQLINLISNYDTWAWYRKRNNNPFNKDPLALNEYFQDKVEKSAEAYHNFLFVEFPTKVRESRYKVPSYLVQDLIHKGMLIVQDKEKLAQNKKFDLITVNGDAIVIAYGYGNYYDTEWIKQMMEGPYSPWKDAKAIIQYQISFQENDVKLSARSIIDGYNCIKLIHTFTDGKGGGHDAAAGGKITFEEFSKFMSTVKPYHKEFPKQKLFI